MTFFKNIFIFLLTSFCMILLMEFYFTQSEMIENLSPELNDKMGVVYSANQNFTYFSEGFGMGRVNNHGLLGKECFVKKNSKTFRIAVLGDSYVQGLQVLERDHFISQLETQLNQNNNAKVEVLNFGISGYSLADMYYYYQNKVEEFKPDLVLYFIDKRDLKQPYAKRKALYPSVEIQNDSLKVNYTFVRSDKYQTFRKINPFLNFNFSKIGRNIYFLNTRRKLSILFDKFYIPKQQQKIKLKKEEESKISEVSKLILQGIKKQTAIIVYRDSLSQSSVNFIENKIGLQTINLNDTLNNLKKEGLSPHYWKITKVRGHWNHAAHKAVGLFLADKIKKANLIKNNSITY